MKSSKARVITNTILGNIYITIGCIIGIPFLLVFLVGLGDLETENAVPALIFCMIMVVISILLILHGAKTKQLIKRFKTYVMLISHENITSISNIALRTSLPVFYVEKDLQKMINKNLFANAYIDKINGQINISLNKNYNDTVTVNNTDINSGIPMEVVECGGCGAKNVKRKSTVTICEYCGSPLV